MPLVDAWSVVLPLLEHWCRAFSEIRRGVDAPTWDAHMDDFRIDWDEIRACYVVPVSLTKEQYRVSVEFSRGPRPSSTLK
jgi:hypothetical protein